jgi:hypothetical protein
MKSLKKDDDLNTEKQKTDEDHHSRHTLFHSILLKAKKGDKGIESSFASPDSSSPNIKMR